MNAMKRDFIPVVLAGLFLLAGCSSTRLVTSWHDPSLPVNKVGKPLVVALAQKEIIRHKTEDEYVRQLAAMGVNAAQSYRFFPDQKELTPETIRAKFPDGRDSVLVTHLVDVKKETVYVPGSTEAYPTGGWYVGGYQRPGYYNSFGAYYAQSYAVVSTPGYTYDYKVYVIETNLYDAATEKMLWTAVTETEDPDSVDSALRDFVRIIIADMEKNNLL